MFKPNNGEWVPLRCVNWFWGGEADKVGTNWTLATKTNNVDPKDFDTTYYPVWTNNVENFQIH
jgi:hypothetical protein